MSLPCDAQSLRLPSNDQVEVTARYGCKISIVASLRFWGSLEKMQVRFSPKRAGNEHTWPSIVSGTPAPKGIIWCRMEFGGVRCFHRANDMLAGLGLRPQGSFSDR